MQVNAALCTRGERPKNGADAQPCLSDVYKNGTRAKRRQADVPLCGRSMVEMLGVLAIIGVLSVGAIAGYSKAMTKYKLNKQAEQYSQLFAATVSVLSENNFSSSEGMHISKVLEKMNLVPAGLIENNWNDAMGNWIERFSKLQYYIHYTSQKAGEHIDIASITSCVNIFEIMKNYAALPVFSDTSIFGGYGITLVSDKRCSKNSKCLSKYSTKDFYTICEEAYELYRSGSSTEFVQTVNFTTG